MHGLVEEATGHDISKGLGRQPQRVSQTSKGVMPTIDGLKF